MDIVSDNAADFSRDVDRMARPVHPNHYGIIHPHGLMRAAKDALSVAQSAVNGYDRHTLLLQRVPCLLQELIRVCRRIENHKTETMPPIPAV